MNPTIIDTNSYKKKHWTYWFLTLIILVSCQQESTLLFPNKRVLQLGDNIAWADPQFDDSNWDASGATLEIGIFWVRFHINFDESVDKLEHKGIQMVSVGSYEAYWDGVLIHKNGKVGDSKEDEIEGQFISQMLIPDTLCQQGPHVLALRLSNYHDKSNNWSWNKCKIEEFHSSVKKELQVTSLMFILGGCFLLVSLYYFLLYFKETRGVETLVFSFMCLLFFTLMIFEYLKFFWSYSYSFHDTRLIIIGCLTAAISILIPLFLCLHLDIPKRKYILSILLFVVVIIAIVFDAKFDSVSQWLSSIMLISSIGISAYAFWLKRKGSGLILLAFLVFEVINNFSIARNDFMLYSYDINLFLSFMILVLTILYSLSQQRKEQQEAYEASLVLSERLKNELLKKNIQPHFIMNTLTSIMEWVEMSPQKAIIFIEALADEFELLNNMADEKMIPIGQEIDLCKKHLEIMGFRKEVAYEWADENIDFSFQIPPAILHTIVENGITHSISPVNKPIKFKLTQVDQSDSVVYRLEVFATNRKAKPNASSGTGFKYIKSRLTESFGNRWSFKSRESPNGWLTEISIQLSV